jgi:protoheme IX farnesyltransferase
MRPEKRLFGYSVLYLFALFAALVADRVAQVQGWFG